ncbi:MAG: recombinase family protein [Alphaproteobacteria bacterium]|nr:recombinase family protein [Alphaproteobacteria bacterium]MBU2083765.1 recombinase family protein [Alphaproteobacteria bacterium]MBU2142551.1 recombinase family protein [Alphaproteobacteria bacterium]MBU2197696.1 recombinase family protein [Alphaproteobacteria bacterium]
MKVGYARVSTRDQDAALQIEALTEAGCEKVFEETASGAQRDRPRLAEALNWVRKGDTLVVWKLDRLARSLRQLIETVELLHQRGIGFVSVTEAIDTTTPGGKMIFHVVGALAEFERDLIKERTNAGLVSAKSRGVQLGRPKAMTDDQIAVARSLKAAGQLSSAKIADHLGVSRATLYRTLSEPL